ncbi:hypothetical protein AALB16_03240 [Lachnospiraceae bacterium 62-35]
MFLFKSLVLSFNMLIVFELQIDSKQRGKPLYEIWLSEQSIVDEDIVHPLYGKKLLLKIADL